MLFAIIASAFVLTGVGSGFIISKVKFNRNISDAKNKSTSPMVDDKSLSIEIKRFDKLKENLATIKQNIEQLDIPIPEPARSWDDTQTSLNKISLFFEKHSKLSAGTEAFILSVLPISQTGEALASFASVAPGLISKAFVDSASALKDGFFDFDDVSSCLGKFCQGISHTSHASLAHALQHDNCFGGLKTMVINGLAEITGVHDATASLSSSIHDMGDVLGSASEVSLDPTDFTDFDISGHIPIITIAISSFRELDLLLDSKTDALTSLKNIGLDAAGAGGGGLVGAKAGALAGSVFGPLGSLFGGIIGGIGGAIGGRSLTNEIKQKPLKNAIDAYQTNANLMRSETRTKSREMLQSINDFATERRSSFKDSAILNNIPVIVNEDTITGIAMLLYRSLLEHIELMKQKVAYMKESIWYSDQKYGIIVSEYEKRITNLTNQLPPSKDFQQIPKFALGTLLRIKIPAQKSNPHYMQKLRECARELKQMNDKNNSSLLVWSYSLNGFYQKTLNEIAQFSNEQMTQFNQFVDKWKQTLSSLENKVNIEKGKLGLN